MCAPATRELRVLLPGSCPATRGLLGRRRYYASRVACGRGIARLQKSACCRPALLDYLARLGVMLCVPGPHTPPVKPSAIITPETGLLPKLRANVLDVCRASPRLPGMVAAPALGRSAFHSTAWASIRRSTHARRAMPGPLDAQAESGHAKAKPAPSPRGFRRMASPPRTTSAPRATSCQHARWAPPRPISPAPGTSR